MKTKKQIKFYSAAEVLGMYGIENINISNELEKLRKGERYDPLAFLDLADDFDLYFCTKHQLFHTYYYETDDSDIYTAANHRPVCPLCLLNIDITA